MLTMLEIAELLVSPAIALAFKSSLDTKLEEIEDLYTAVNASNELATSKLFALKEEFKSDLQGTGMATHLHILKLVYMSPHPLI
jgi:hypothetical protein